MWRAGDRVRALPMAASINTDNPWGEKLSKPRLGTVVEVPEFAARTGAGTLCIEWDSLTGEKRDPETWRMWLHSSLLEPVA